MHQLNRTFKQSEVKCLLKQLLEAVAAMHERWILHRDLKTSNLLLNNKGILKVCDFGLARKFEEPLKNYTRTVVTLYYRAPELLLGIYIYIYVYNNKYVLRKDLFVHIKKDFS